MPLKTDTWKIYINVNINVNVNININVKTRKKVGIRWENACDCIRFRAKNLPYCSKYLRLYLLRFGFVAEFVWNLQRKSLFSSLIW